MAKLASNMKGGMTMTQSVIAEELDAYESAMWFTSSYMITAASVAPCWSPINDILSWWHAPDRIGLFAVGSIVVSMARTFAIFVSGRVLVGIGGGGILTLSRYLSFI